jgi:hypothetical protein
MGSIYTRKDRNAAGVLVPSAVIWLKYRDASGRIVRETTGTDNAQEAKRLLKLREGAAAEGKTIIPRADKVTINALAEDLRAEYKSNGRRSAEIAWSSPSRTSCRRWARRGRSTSRRPR